MASTKNTKASSPKSKKATTASTKKTEVVEKNEKIENTVNQELLDMIAVLKEEIATLTQQNAKLQQERLVLVSQDVSEDDTESCGETTVKPEILPNKVRVYHLTEMLGGTTTYIELSGTKRALTRMGELMTLEINDFEELVGKYRSFFDAGILAVGADSASYAALYDLPIYDNEARALLNSKKLKEVATYTHDQLKTFYNSLSEKTQEQFLSYWLGKVYEKTKGYYDVEKMRLLDTISGTSAFAPIIMEIENNERRKSKDVINADKL